MYAFDLRGHGYSAGDRVERPSPFDDYVMDFDMFALPDDARRGRARLSRSGHSMGGAMHRTLLPIMMHPEGCAE